MNTKTREEPIRVAQVVGKLSAGGVEAVVWNYYRHIDHTGVQFDCYIDADSTLPPPQDIMDMGARFITIPPYQSLLPYMRALKRHFSDGRYAIVHSHMNTLSAFPLFAAKLAGVPVRIAHSHSTLGKGEGVKNALKVILRPFVKLFATQYCACSEYSGRWLFGDPCFEKGEVTVFPNAIDVQRFAFDTEARAEIRHALGIGENFVVGHIGRFCFQKNHAFLLDIFQAVHEREPSAVLLLAGDGPLRGAMEAKAKAMGIFDSILFLGVRNDAQRLYQGMDVFVLPSHFEGLPVVGVEAQAAGLPCVFSDAITKEAKLLDTTRMLSLGDSAQAWARCVLEAMRTQRGDTTAVLREKGFAIHAQGDRLSEYYEALLENETI